MLNYSPLSRRARNLEVVLPAPLGANAVSGGSRAPAWRMEGARARLFQAPHVAQSHLAMDAKSDQICTALMTHQGARDANVSPDLLDQLPPDSPVDILVSSFKCNTLNRVRCCDEEVQASERGRTRGHHD